MPVTNAATSPNVVKPYAPPYVGEPFEEIQCRHFLIVEPD